MTLSIGKFEWGGYSKRCCVLVVSSVGIWCHEVLLMSVMMSRDLSDVFRLMLLSCRRVANVHYFSSVVFFSFSHHSVSFLWVFSCLVERPVWWFSISFDLIWFEGVLYIYTKKHVYLYSDWVNDIFGQLRLLNLGLVNPWKNIWCVAETHTLN